MAEKNAPSSAAPSPDDVAIIGMAAHLPGARNVREYWKNLVEGKESVKAFGEEELLAAGVPREVFTRANYVRSGVILENLEWFDAEFFGFSPKEAAIMDPQHRHFLECAWEALEDAAHPPESFDGTIAVFGGCGMGSYFVFNLLTNPALVDQVGLFLLRHTGNDKDFLATRVSYCFDLKGPSINVQTACSTSLVAVHQAVQSLLSGECDLALAGGVTIELPHHRGYLYHEGEILSPDGHCRAFDHRSQGTIFGSGAGVVVLRRAEDALRDGDHVYAIVKGSAINNDGSGKVGYLAPSVDGQAKAVIEALSVAGVDADTIDYVEAHGTGTAMGDPIEISALTQAFRTTSQRKGFCGVGSVKANIGHLDTAAGVASLIKVVLALEHGELPPTINYEKENPAIAFAATPFVVQAARAAWPRTAAKPRRAGVNSLGVGGTNAHVILEEAPRGARSPARAVPGTSKQPFELLRLSARSKKALDQSAADLARALRADPDLDLADVAYTLDVGRRAFQHRRVLACASASEAAHLLESNDARRVFTHAASGKRESIAFLFPGGGAQYPRMGRGLYEANEVFRRHLDQGFAAFERRTRRDLRPLFFPDDASLEHAARELERPSLQLPAIFLVECALAEAWKSLGVTPAALIGHSLGENTAACVAGVMSFEAALGLVTLRGELFERVPAGGMLSVSLDATALEKLLGPELDLAVVNAPGLSVASGPVGALDDLAARLAEREIEARRVPIAIAAHSRMLDPILAEFRAYLASIELRAPSIPIVSNRTGTWLTSGEARDPGYWVEHLRRTIRFADGIGTLLADEHRVLLEVGPGKVLSSLAKQHAKLVPTHNVIASLRHPDEAVDDEAFFLASAGRLWASGVAVDLGRSGAGEKRRRVSLPTYPFQRQRYWIEPGALARDARPVADERPKRLADFDAWFTAPVWKRAPLAEPAATAPTTWLLFLDESGLGEELAERLRARGHAVISVREADAYEKTGEHQFCLSPEHGRGGYDALVKDLVAAGQMPQRIVHLWMVTEEETFRPGSSFFHRNQERGFYSLFFLAQALGDEGVTTPLHVDVVSNGMQRVDREPLRHPEKATLLGPCRVIPRELAGVTCTSIDVEGGTDRGSKRARSRARSPSRARSKGRAAPTALDLLERELLAPRTDTTVAHRGGERFVLAYERAELAAPATDSVPREGGVFLVTGGLGGMGLAIGEHLARTTRAKLAFVSRSTFPDRSAWSAWLAAHASDDATSRRIAKLLEIERAGGELFLASADVTDVEEMRGVIAAVRQRFGAIDGVIHAAGVLRDDPLQAKSQGDVEDVFTPKVHGTLVLDELFRARAPVDATARGADARELDRPPELFVLCSSTSALTGPAGQIDYAAANAFLDAYAQSRADDPATRVVAIDWGVWRDVGMAAEAARKQTGGAPRRAPIAHPLFDAVLDDSAHATFVASLSARAGVRAGWILDEHRTKAGQAVWPGTGYVELARAALAAHGESRPFEIEDLFFLRPLHVPDGDAKETRVRLSRDDEGYGFQVQSAFTTDGGRAALETHAEARLLLHDLPLAGSLDLAAIRARCTRVVEAPPGGTLATGQEAHLAFGPRWRVLRKVAYGAGEALAELALDPRFEAELESFGLHPALLDLATGYAMELVDGYSPADGLWVPVSYKRVRVHRPLTRAIASWVRVSSEPPAQGFAVFDVVITDPRGSVLVEIEDFAIKRLQAGADFALASKPSERELEFLPAENDAATRSLSPAEASFQHNLEQGILPAEGARALERVLAAAPRPQVVVSSLDLAASIAEQDRARPTARSASDTFARPELANDYVEPRDGIERALVGYWQELLGVDRVGIQDSFFDLGGHSLIAVRLFAKIKKAYHVEYPISILFEAPTIERCAEMIRESTGTALDEGGDASTSGAPKKSAHRTRYVHLVPMHAKESRSEHLPFFLVAGMFGNVLNLRHLANLVGADRAIYGLQARGLYGDHAPHETFEEMARDYLAELATVQPRGPYLLGGFSGGGITAYEMAQQLSARGEEVLLLVLLDTPLPQSTPLAAHERMLIHLQRAKRQGPRYFTDWATNRVKWELERIKKRREGPRERRAGEFHSETIEQAFRRALERYDLRRYLGRVTLFRPKLDESHVLGPGRVTNAHREFVFHDNGWGPHVGEVEVHEVPGDHDGMVLEPNVRVLATRLRRAIERAEAQLRVPRSKAS